MYLKKLELIGFKSFATRTEFEFVPGITVIVGPNGSGKSNVTDGIRWVLGEQSARTLRGSKMEDVIFAGSDTRKPIGYCEVTITFGNESRRLPLDYSEVTVTRRVYRSGESEYYLNKQACRLKDIHELFMDTGIGRDTYSMIGQGRIDEILSHKSDERRAIFEDAAGIVKYKNRKKEAEKKLEDTSQNLVRIHDLVFQLEDQIEPLIEKVEIAHEFKSLQEELKGLEIGLYVHKIDDLHGKWQESCELVRKFEEENVLLASNLSAREASLEQVTYKLTQHEEAWAKEQEMLLAVSSDLEKAEGQKQLIQEKFVHLEEKKKQFQDRKNHLLSEVNRTQDEKERLERLLEEKAAEEASIQDKFKPLKTNLFVEQTEKIATISQVIEEKKRKIIELQSEQNYTLQQLDEIEENLNRLKNQEKETRKQVDSLATQEKEVEQKIVSILQQLTESSAQRMTGQASLQEIEKKEQALSQETQQTEQKVTQLRSQIDLLQDIQADHTGFFQGVKEILLARDRAQIKGIHGAVSQLMNVPHEYEASIETALGGAIQHLVVENEKVGRQGILWLKERRLGRATFLPLDVLQDRYLSRTDLANVAKIPGFVGVASDLISTQAKYEIVARNLLGLIVISRDLESATRIAQALRYLYRIVTMDGDVINPGGSMSGGSRQKTKVNLIGRPRQLEELKIELERMEEILQEKQHEGHNIQQKKKQISQDITSILSRIELLQANHQELVGQKNETLSQMKSQASITNTIREDFQQLSKRKQSSTIRNDEISREIHLLQDLLVQLTTQAEELHVALKKQEEVKEEYQEQVTNWKVQIARLQQEKINLKENKERIVFEMEQLTSQKDGIILELAKLQEEYEQNEQKLQEVDQKIKETRVKKEELQEELSHVRSQRDALIVERETQTKEIQKQRTTLRNQEIHLRDQEVRKNRLDVELQHFLQKLADDYELSFERAKEEYSGSINMNETEKEIQLIRQEIEALGEVQLGAIEEHERLTSRLSFLQKQEEDLLEAKKTMYDIIGQMETEMGKRFQEAFASIRQEFQQVFTQMFGGGSADLTFSDPNNLLETGIEIVAQPPGKKLTNLTLLSGGERALTAIVLLFAILKVKPVPFCVFDEVEAALDEVNLDRFNRYLREFSHQTQFVLISHRKRTMEAADVLYGITMQESGVSQLVSVKLAGVSAYQEVAAGKVEE